MRYLLLNTNLLKKKQELNNLTILFRNAKNELNDIRFDFKHGEGRYSCRQLKVFQILDLGTDTKIHVLSLLETI